jgi:hypothetical protein
MKIHYKKGQRVEQFGAIKIDCTDKMMAEILSVTHRFPKWEAERLEQQFRAYRSGKESFFEYCLTSCAKLKIGQTKGTFYIYSYSADGKDGKVSVEELKMLNGLRIALHHQRLMHRMLRSNEDFPSLGKLFD